MLKGNATKVNIGDTVVLAIKKVSPQSAIKKGDVCKAIIVRTKKGIRRNDGTYIRFEDNAAILIEKTPKGEIKALGKRIFGMVPREIREKGEDYKTIVNLAQEVI